MEHVRFLSDAFQSADHNSTASLRYQRVPALWITLTFIPGVQKYRFEQEVKINVWDVK